MLFVKARKASLSEEEALAAACHEIDDEVSSLLGPRVPFSHNKAIEFSRTQRTMRMQEEGKAVNAITKGKVKETVRGNGWSND